MIEQRTLAISERCDVVDTDGGPARAAVAVFLAVEVRGVVCSSKRLFPASSMS